jgi:hypothetical protein
MDSEVHSELEQAREPNAWKPKTFQKMFGLPNVVVEWLAFLLRIREIPGSNLGPETGCPDWFVVLLSTSSQMPG